MFVFALAFAVTLQSDTSGAYLDARSAELVQLARLRRDVVDRSISHYSVVAKERISMGLRTRLRDRLFYRRETASRIDWTRGGDIKIEVLAAREAIPVATQKVQIPGDLKNFVPRLAFDPMDQDALLQIDSTGLRHPLASGSEEHYQFRTGDSTTITLADRTIRLVELRIIPRRRDIRLISGSFWIDTQTHSVVQIVFRMAKDFDFEEDADSAERRDLRRMPGIFKPIRGELQYVTIEYGLMDLRWWLPRLIAAEGVFQMGPIRTPLNYERSYSDYHVEGDTVPALMTRARLAEIAATLPPAERPCRPSTEMSVGVSVGEDDDKPNEKTAQRRRERVAAQQKADSTKLATDTAYARRRADAAACNKRYKITIADSATLMTSKELPPSIYGDNEELADMTGLSKIAEKLENLAEAPWQLITPRVQWPWNGPGLTRYNKVEGLSLGVRADVDLGRLRADAMARVGFADLEPNGEIGFVRASESKWLRAAAYRRLSVMDVTNGEGGLSSTLGALFLGNDERDYFRTLGAELIAQPPEAKAQWFTWRAYAERQSRARVETEFSVAHLIDEGNVFDSNRTADRADQLGTELTLHYSRGQNPSRPRLNSAFSAEAETGDFQFVKPSLLAQVTFPLPFGLAGALEGAAGTSFGDVPVQSLWFIGGYRSARGYDIGELAGNAFWRTRAELGTQIPVARIVVFGDAAWAGDRDNLSNNPKLLSVGAGFSIMDGLLRFDVARALRNGNSWRFNASVDGVF